MTTKYILTENQLRSLLEDHLTLTALENGGVDNWEWYEDSIHEFEYYDEKRGMNTDRHLEKYPKIEE